MVARIRAYQTGLRLYRPAAPVRFRGAYGSAGHMVQPGVRFRVGHMVQRGTWFSGAYGSSGGRMGPAGANGFSGGIWYSVGTWFRSLNWSGTGRGREPAARGYVWGFRKSILLHKKRRCRTESGHKSRFGTNITGRHQHEF